MKCFIHVLFIFCISQSVFCQINEELDVFLNRKTVFSNIFSGLEALNIIQRSEHNKMYEILSKPIEEINELQSQKFDCNDTATISRINDSKLELNSFFTECIDTNYVELVGKLHEFDSKLMKLQCEMSDEGAHEIIDIAESECDEESVLQIVSCIFSEPEVIEISKNVSKAVNSTLELFGGNDKQCGILNRIQKCVQNSRTNCNGSYSLKLNEFNTLMELFECKVDIFEITKSTREPLTGDEIVDTLKNATMNCNINEIRQNFLMLKTEIESKVEHLNTTNEIVGTLIETLCGKDVNDQINENEFISKTASTLTNCVDPNYVNHVEKLKSVAIRSIGAICKSQEQFIKSAVSFIDLIRNKNYNLKLNTISQLAGCIFSQVEVRELIADKNLISNFTLDLLEGSKKKCEVLNDIQMCFIETFDKTINKEFSNSFKHISDIIIEALDSKRHFQVMLNGWNNSENQSGMYKEFIFNDFNEAFGFMTRVALYAAQLEYYPELYTANNKVKISVVSDQVGNSLKLAKFANEIPIIVKQ